MLFTYMGMAVRFDESKVRSMGRMARGVRASPCATENDYVVGCEVVNGDESILVVCENGFGKRSQVEDFRQTNRGGVGCALDHHQRTQRQCRWSLVCPDDDGMVMMSAAGQTVRISMRDLRVMGRNTQGVKLVNLKENDYLVAIQKLEGGAAEGVEEGVDAGENGSPSEIPSEAFEEKQPVAETTDPVDPS